MDILGYTWGRYTRVYPKMGDSGGHRKTGSEAFFWIPRVSRLVFGSLYSILMVGWVGGVLGGGGTRNPQNEAGIRVRQPMLTTQHI